MRKAYEFFKHYKEFIPNFNTRPATTFFETGEGTGIANAPVLPDVIYVFRRPHLDMGLARDELIVEIETTLVHEIAHYFGIDDDHLVGHLAHASTRPSTKPSPASGIIILASAPSRPSPFRVSKKGCGDCIRFPWPSSPTSPRPWPRS